MQRVLLLLFGQTFPRSAVRSERRQRADFLLLPAAASQTKGRYVGYGALEREESW